MQEIAKNLFIGDIGDFQSLDIAKWALVHATQTVHYSLMGWDRKFNKPPRNNPNYIKLELENRFSLNWVDGGAHLYNWTGVETFVEILDFIDRWISKRPILIHCDQGLSRSPTVGLLYLAKREKAISNDTYQEAYNDFIRLFPSYSPSGIGEYVSKNWEFIK